ncbi:MAG: outer membrane beta-barrel protein [Chitinophagaceae bacterium]|nr:outer membrane beta-barrel protein [Chitinophagaceae bacterium]
MFLLVFIGTMGLAQEKEGRFAISIGGGIAQPAGRFAAAPVLSLHNNAGNAVTGIAGRLLLQYQLKNKLGFSLSVEGAINSQDKKRFRQIIQNGLSEGFSVKATAKSWKVFKVMPGIYYSFSVSGDSKLHIQPMLSAGVCKTAVPAQSYAYAKNDVPGTAVSISMGKRDLPLAFCYQAGAGLNYYVNNKLFLLANLAYFASSPVDKYGYNVGGDNTTPGTWVPAEKKYALSSFNALVGVGVRF